MRLKRVRQRMTQNELPLPTGKADDDCTIQHHD